MLVWERVSGFEAVWFRLYVGINAVVVIPVFVSTHVHSSGFWVEVSGSSLIIRRFRAAWGLRMRIERINGW